MIYKKKRKQFCTKDYNKTGRGYDYYYKTYRLCTAKND